MATDETLPLDHTQSILEVTKLVGSLLKTSGQPFALAGSVAAYAQGVPLSLQHDSDFCVRRQDSEAIVKALRDGGVEVRQPPEDWLLKANANSEEIDLIFELAHRPVTGELLDRAELLEVDSVRMPVLSPTDLVGSLLAALSEHHCDYSALLPIARALRERVDWDQLRQEHGSRPLADAFLYLLQRLEVIDAGEVPS
ncbi:nucleotidyltransferase family protein [Streptomyces sp. NRRL B-24720]|uniref:nucleotidyltransferase family protein n=1 Tax=Streptomyces sp. NRRL B-24720 TaxID=1476876 RepID=UPI00068BBCDF|nr:nucleotidyltransferase family protein [Streptomyces sp. NRRL B-24720]